MHLHASTGIVKRFALAKQSLLQLVSIHVQDLLALLKITQHVQTVSVIVSGDRAVDDRDNSVIIRILGWKTVLRQSDRVAASLSPKHLFDFRPNVTWNFAGILTAAR